MRRSTSKRAVDVGFVVQRKRTYMESRNGHSYQIVRSESTPKTLTVLQYVCVIPGLLESFDVYHKLLLVRTLLNTM